MAKKQTRSEARELVFKIIFQGLTNDEDYNLLFDEMPDEFPPSIENMPYINATAVGALQRREELEERISAVLPQNRKITRLSKPVLAILLLAVYEILYAEDVPEKVAINEAVELAKKFAEEDAASFVNGVLGGVVNK